MPFLVRFRIAVTLGQHVWPFPEASILAGRSSDATEACTAYYYQFEDGNNFRGTVFLGGSSFELR